jgi:hypothetical protein
MVWVFYAIEAATEGRITDRLPWRWLGAGNDQVIEITWSHAPERVRSARAPSFLDLGGNKVLFVGGWRRASSPLTGYGWRVAKQWVVDNVLRGGKIPEPFGEDPEVILARERAVRRERDRAERARRAAELAAERERAEAEQRRQAELERQRQDEAERLKWEEDLRRYVAASDTTSGLVANWFRWRSWIRRR